MARDVSRIMQQLIITQIFWRRPRRPRTGSGVKHFQVYIGLSHQTVLF